MKPIEEEIHKTFSRMKEETNKIFNEFVEEIDKVTGWFFFIMAIPYILLLIAGIVGFIRIGF